ncbi:PTS system, lactose/cellobiose family IIC component [Enterococcus phoeniculicola]|jgi:PTS system cellobiose-specific IIC component|uniref:Permease IIC component n=1 Tax=Enterococcus phoeniculicola ATCC BAA-412 TaxID=1158610 RepID=R3TIG5_9ENTE|nr:PTS sugar transporter subunit IIC [Enterococcus phoeniculicola]EOL41224.1 PTS system, lactose/cellobiose family IIC component [Enterococcus phoeniculicola ATCC BAA-412]EOT78638.1 PTS system, cellobiose-specific IIC component [Enterococcus phoeniculicola ATCC BAA-412]OJG70604.1 PTS system, lactose/cellobiose family IIC component [Enterococcus phoeniculicola]
MFDVLEKAMMPLAEKLGKNKVLVAIRDGFLITTPLIIVGSLFLLFSNFPIPGWEDFWTGILGDQWSSWFGNVSGAVFDVVGFLSCFGTAYAYGRELEVDSIQAAAVAIVGFLILTPMSMLVDGVEGSLGAIDLQYLGTNGIFLGLVVALVSVRIYAYVSKKGWTIKMPDGVPPAVSKSFEALIPSGIVMVIFFFVRIGFEFTSYETVHNFIFEILQTPLKGAGNTLLAQIIYSLACTIFWFFGINGPAVANSVFAPVTKVLTMENLNALQAGKDLPNIFTDPFSNFFTNFGGGGSTLSLVIVMVLFCKSQRIKKLGNLSLIPGVFGINEPIIFGLPIVLNPIIIIPFILTPTINLLLSTLVTKLGIIPYTTGVALPWTTPIGFSGYLSTGSLVAAVWQFLLLALGCVIYYPFIKTLDKQYLKEEAEASNKTVEEEDISFDDISFDDL